VNKSLKDRVADLRCLYQNPYALIEYLEDFDEAASAPMEVADARPSQLSASRKVMQDPYAYLDGDGGFSAEANSSKVASSRGGAKPEKPRGTSADNQKRRYNDAAIEGKAIALQRHLWLERDRLWEGAAPTNPLDVLDIRKALHLSGYELIFESGLGHDPRTQIEVAGLIDRDAKVVRCSLQFLEPYQRFTLAHELGHAVLHPDAGGIHRDRPLDGAKRAREPGEWEADRFAAFFLMPAKLLRECFFQRFGTECFRGRQAKWFTRRTRRFVIWLAFWRPRRLTTLVLSSRLQPNSAFQWERWHSVWKNWVCWDNKFCDVGRPRQSEPRDVLPFQQLTAGLPEGCMGAIRTHQQWLSVNRLSETRCINS
jgi:hypothetical protein